MNKSEGIAPLLRELAPYFCSQSSAAEYFGYTRERMRQLDKLYGLGLKQRRQKNTWIEWPCSRCGKTVGMWTRIRGLERTGYCKPCSNTKTHCLRGHPLADGTGVGGGRICKPCNAINQAQRRARRREEAS